MNEHIRSISRRMKIFGFVIFLGSCISFFSYVDSLKCIMCDPNHEGLDCKETYIDCEEDHELGHVFDSCFTYQMILVNQDGWNFTHLEKNCSISEGCTALNKIMCDDYNETLRGAVRSCDIQCCNNGDYCNHGVPSLSAKKVQESLRTSQTSGGSKVLGYKSTASTDMGDKWKLFFGVFCSFIYFIMSR